jgi:DNA-binding NarL/FixJ family response regulator/DNA-binding CsgD family transcriptional regulator
MSDPGLAVVIVDDQQHYYPALLAEHLAAAGHRVVLRAERVEDVGPGVRADAVVCDLRLVRRRGRSGEEAVRRLVGQRRRVLLTTAVAAQEEVLASIAAGAVGYISKARPPAEHVRALEQLADRGFFVGRELAALLVADARRFPLERGELSRTELDVLRAVAIGDGEGDVRARFRLPPDGVEGILGRALDLGRRRRAGRQLSARARQIVELIGCRHLSRADVAEELHITDDTLGEHLTRIRRYYLKACPDDEHIKPMAAAEALARLWGLCDHEGPAGSL